MTKKIVLTALILVVGVVVGGAILSLGHPNDGYLPKAEAALIGGGARDSCTTGYTICYEDSQMRIVICKEVRTCENFE